MICKCMEIKNELIRFNETTDNLHISSQRSQNTKTLE